MSAPVEKRALVVEDDALVAEFLRAAMGDAGWEVIVASTRAEALDRLQGYDPFTLVLLDLKLPDGDGLSLARDIHDRHALTEIAVVTGDGKVPEAVQAMRYGVRDFLDKPVRLDDLRALLDRAYTRISVRQGPEEEKAERITHMFAHMSDRLAQVEQEIAALKRHAGSA